MMNNSRNLEIFKKYQNISLKEYPGKWSVRDTYCSDKGTFLCFELSDMPRAVYILDSEDKLNFIMETDKSLPESLLYYYGELNENRPYTLEERYLIADIIHSVLRYVPPSKLGKIIELIAQLVDTASGI